MEVEAMADAGSVQISMEMIFTIAVNIAVVAAAFSRQSEQIKTLFFQLGDVKQKHDIHVDKLDKVCNQVSALCARLDAWLGSDQLPPALMRRGHPQ